MVDALPIPKYRMAADQCGSCYMGIYFDERVNQDLSRYREFVDYMQAHYPEGGMLLAD